MDGGKSSGQVVGIVVPRRTVNTLTILIIHCPNSTIRLNCCNDVFRDTLGLRWKIIYRFVFSLFL